MVVDLEPLNPGTKIMLHDELGGHTQIICTDCWHSWVVDHQDVLEMDETDAPVSQCPKCGDPVLPMNVSTEVGHA